MAVGLKRAISSKCGLRTMALWSAGYFRVRSGTRNWRLRRRSKHSEPPGASRHSSASAYYGGLLKESQNEKKNSHALWPRKPESLSGRRGRRWNAPFLRLQWPPRRAHGFMASICHLTGRSIRRGGGASCGDSLWVRLPASPRSIFL